MSFDQFTEKIANSEMDDFLDRKSLSLQQKNNQFVSIWNICVKQDIPKEQNLLCPVQIESILNEDIITEIYVNFICALQEQNLEWLNKNVEKSFCKKISANFENFKNLRLKINSGNVKQIDLYNVNNIIGLGIKLNRTKNPLLNKFNVLLKDIQGIPTTHYMIKKPKKEDKIQYFVSVDLALSIEEASIEIINDNGEDLAPQNLKNNVHLLKIEAELFHSDQQSQLNIDQIKGFKKLDQLQFMISDFDNFMEGNELLRQSHDQF